MGNLPASVTFPVAECFGPTFQGEGPSAGRRCAFVRFGHCNLHCRWCDADYTWVYSANLPNLGYTKRVYDPAVELTPMTAEAIAADIVARDVRMVVITGGEPLLYQRELPSLLALFTARNMRVEVETNGTLAPAPDVNVLVDQWNVSPKLANSGNTPRERYKPTALRTFRETGKATFKFVVSSDNDLTEIDDITVACNLPASSVWLMPEGCDPQTVNAHAQAVASAALARGWNLTMRMQVALWGDKRGV